MVFAAIAMSIGLVGIDRALKSDYISFFGFLYSVNPEGARSILSTIAASMMTVAGVTFSITIVVLNLAKRNFPSSYCYDDKDKLRLKLKPLTYSGILNASFDQIRQYGHASVAVTIRLLEMLILIAEQTRHPDQRRAIHRQANMILRGSQNSIFEQNDRDDVQKRYDLLLSVLNNDRMGNDSYQ
jgi:uncharacterized membrane protein